MKFKWLLLSVISTKPPSSPGTEITDSEGVLVLSSGGGFGSEVIISASEIKTGLSTIETGSSTIIGIDDIAGSLFDVVLVMSSAETDLLKLACSEGIKTGLSTIETGSSTIIGIDDIAGSMLDVVLVISSDETGLLTLACSERITGSLLVMSATDSGLLIFSHTHYHHFHCLLIFAPIFAVELELFRYPKGLAFYFLRRAF